MILNRALRNMRGAFTMRANEFGDSSIPSNSEQSPIWGNGTGEAGALAVSAVLSCVKALHDDLKTMPFSAFSGDPQGAHTRMKKQPLIVAQPFGPDMDPQVGLAQMAASYALRGNGYAEIILRDADGNPTMLSEPIHPDTLRVKFNRETGRIEYRTANGRIITRENMVHVTGLMLPGQPTGVDVVTAQRVNLDLAHSVGDYAAGFFRNGGSPSGVISVPGPGDRRRAREVKEGWEDQHAGTRNAHRPAVLFGNATWTPMTVSPENAQFLQTRQFLREEICGWFGVPLHRIQAVPDNASMGGGKGLDAIDAGYVRHGLLPVGRSFEIEWRRLIPGGDRTWATFDFDEFLRGSADIRAQVAQIHRVTGIRVIDEIRGDEGWAPLPNGQGTDPFQPLNSNTGPSGATGGASNTPNPGTEPGAK